MPDAVLWDANGHALAIEAKVTAPLTFDQLRRHLRTLQARGYAFTHGLAITGRADVRKPEKWTRVTWIDVHNWARNQSGSPWAQELASYIEIVEIQMSDEEIDAGFRLTEFSGIHFSEQVPYTYQAGKLVLRGLMDAVCDDRGTLKKLGFSSLPARRGAITDQGLVWDYLAAKEDDASHTRHIHYSAGIWPNHADADVTIPNGAATLWRLLRDAGYDRFLSGVRCYLEGLGKLPSSQGVLPQIIVCQRRYPNQRAEAIVDANLVVDPRTSFADLCDRVTPRIRYQPEWLKQAFELICNKQSNLQFQIGCKFEYEKCAGLASPDAKDLFIRVWLSGKSFLDAFGISVLPNALSHERSRRKA